MKIRVKENFNDKAHNILRKKGDEFQEDDARADKLIKKGFAELIEEIKKPKKENKEKVVETATKPEPKKEKAVKKNAKKS